MTEVLALVGACGGSGTTRLSVELAAALARAGQSVTVLDAALDTQGLARYAPGRLDPDLSAVLTGEADLGDALVEVWPDLSGTVQLAPVHAPFERMARAKTTAAAEQFETVVGRVDSDVVLLDVPPVGDNVAVAAVTAAEARLIVAPDETRGTDHVPQIRGRLVDVGATADGVVATWVAGETPSQLRDATAAIPAGDPDVTKPSAVTTETPLAVAVSALATERFDCDATIEPEDEGLLARYVPSG
jgi:MinD-like ATPase involved in chromosome partitioning or flagellar assembly